MAAIGSGAVAAAARRELIVGRFDAGTPRGTLLHIATNPYALPRFMLGAGDEAEKARARAAIDWLDSLGVSEDGWRARVEAARGVGTQLWPLGSAATRNVVNAAYVQAAANLHVRTGAPLTAPPYPL